MMTISDPSMISKWENLWVFKYLFFSLYNYQYYSRLMKPSRLLTPTIYSIS